MNQTFNMFVYNIHMYNFMIINISATAMTLIINFLEWYLVIVDYY